MQFRTIGYYKALVFEGLFSRIQGTVFRKAGGQIRQNSCGPRDDDLKAADSGTHSLRG